MKTVALRQALDKGGYDAAFGGARRDEEKSRAKERVYSFRDSHHLGPQKPAPRTLEPLQRQSEPWRIHPRLPPLQLDRTRRLAIHLPRKHPHRPPLLRRRPPRRGTQRRPDHGR